MKSTEIVAIHTLQAWIRTSLVIIACSVETTAGTKEKGLVWSECLVISCRISAILHPVVSITRQVAMWDGILKGYLHPEQ